MWGQFVHCQLPPPPVTKQEPLLFLIWRDDEDDGGGNDCNGDDNSNDNEDDGDNDNGEEGCKNYLFILMQQIQRTAMKAPRKTRQAMVRTATFESQASPS